MQGHPTDATYFSRKLVPALYVYHYTTHISDTSVNAPRETTPADTKARSMFKRLFTVVAAASALLLTACTAAPAPAAAPQDADDVIVFDDFDYAPQRLEVAAGEPLRVHLRNDGAIVHDLVFEDGWQSGQVRPGDAITVELEPQTASSVAWCSVPGHRDAGMELEVVVRQGDDG
jgi:uncharacterized cupredoxin-like copper-binding protein